ncbi:MAG: hypothetical protein MRK01_16360 [Candidatus Scalindua sp.]|nr:hypothetical protein [Candidatus Scalindua sp.]
MNGQPLTIIAEIHEQVVKQIDPVYLISPENLEFAPLTRDVINDERLMLLSVSKEVAVSMPNKIFIKQSWGRFKEVRPDLLIQVYSILVEEKNKIPNRLISTSIPHIVILSENQKIKHKSEIMLWQQLFEKGDIFLGRRACLQQKRIPPISGCDCDLMILGEEKQNIELGSYWAGYIASYAMAKRKDILEVYCSFLSTLLSDGIINFPVL